MATGQIESLAGTIADIGPMYPFVGTEMIWVIVGVVFWLAWHVIQAKKESREWEEDLRKFGGKQLPGEEYFDH